MSGTVFEPDLDFLEELRKNGGQSLKKCYQCATCTVVCNLTPDDHPFPRKEMIWAQWGMKDRLLYNPDIWLCHLCGDCTKHCPRGAEPSNLIAAVRNISFRHLAFPSFMGTALSAPVWLVPLIALPVAVLLFALYLVNGITIPEGTIVYSKFLPIRAIDSVFLPAAILSLSAAAVGVKRFWKGLVRSGFAPSVQEIVSATVETVKEILAHRRFGKCEANSDRRWGHLLLFFGFIALFVTTNMVMVYHYLFHRETPLELLDPIKLLGNIGAAAAIGGGAWIIVRRVGSSDASTYYDWTFILSLYFTVITGIGSELARLSGMAQVAYPMYFTHLTLVFFLIVYMPYSKFAHMLYRTTAMVYARAAGRNKK